jgi:hypothetical protein
VYGPEITTCHYKGLLHEYVMLCYCFPLGPACSAKISPIGPSCTMWAWANHRAISHSSEQDTQPIVFLISKQVAPYRTNCGTCCPGVSTPKIRSLVDSSTTCHDDINHLHHSNHCSNHNIDPHKAKSHLDGSKITSLTLSHKPNSTLERWKDLHVTHDYMAKQY